VKSGCLILHGLTGTPATVSILQQAFMGAGFMTSAPCLAGHGSTVKALSMTSWQDWYDTARIAFQALRKEVEQVFCAGISLGALLALKLALDEGWGIRALALMSTPLRLSLKERVLIAIVNHSLLKRVITSVPKDFEASVADEEGRFVYEDVSLPEIPAHAVFEICKLQKDVLKSLGKISNPIIAIHALGDKVAPVRNLKILESSVASEVFETVILRKSRHVISMDLEKDVAAQAAVAFFKRFLK
jgi:carboxylesterase